jgi:hypothetical protein
VKTRYAVTYKRADGLRTMVHGNQGRFLRDTREEAEQALRDLLANNSAERLVSVFGRQALGTFRVDPFECYDHGDAVGIYVKE